MYAKPEISQRLCPQLQTRGREALLREAHLVSLASLPLVLDILGPFLSIQPLMPHRVGTEG